MVDSTENGLRQATISIGKNTPSQCQNGFYKTHTTGKIMAKRRKSTKPETRWAPLEVSRQVGLAHLWSGLPTELAIRQNRLGEGKLTKKGGCL